MGFIIPRKEVSIIGKQVNLSREQSQPIPYRNGIVNFKSENRVNHLFRKDTLHPQILKSSIKLKCLFMIQRNLISINIYYYIYILMGNLA